MRCWRPHAGFWGGALASWSTIARHIRVPLGFAFAVLYLWLAKPTPESVAAGAAIIVPGLLLRALASGHVQKNEQLATSGPYAYTRNPLYLGSLVLACGFAVAARSWWVGMVILVFFLAIYIPVIRSEEAFLRGRFPHFEEYARHVPSLLPRLRRFGQTTGEFSWKLYRKHREYQALIGAVIIAAALLAKMIWLER
jgi:protein-S-isoprenylcysteine O-methyltransferase Ste14